MKKRKLRSSSPVELQALHGQTDTLRLPHDVLAFNIFILLPLRQLVRLRTLSKSFNELLQSKSLLSAWRPSSDCWLLMSKVLPPSRTSASSSSLRAYDVSYNYVHNEPFPMPLHSSLPLSLISSFMHSLSMVEEAARVNLIASAGGLICIGEFSISENDCRLLVFNPLTGSWKTLPKPPGFKSSHDTNFALNITAQSTADGCLSYHIILVHDNKFDLNIYDSITQKWNLVLFDMAVRARDIRAADVFCEAYTDEEHGSSSTVLVGYNIDQDRWYFERVFKPWEEELRDEIAYIRHKGQIYMVGGLSPTTRMTRDRATRLAQLFLLEPESGWAKVRSLNDSEPCANPPCCPYYDSRPLRYNRSPMAISVEGLRPQFQISTPAITNTCPYISSQWLELLLSPPPFHVALSFYIPSFTAKP